jgi:hypothetical protein
VDIGWRLVCANNTPIENQEGSPTWSPYSTQIAFGGMTHAAEKPAGQLVIHIFNLKTRQFSNVPSSEGLWSSRWSPDRRYIAALTEESRNLMLFDFHTGRSVRLATMAKIPDLACSQYEDAICLNGEPTAGVRAIFCMNVRSSQPPRLARLVGRSELDRLGLTSNDPPLIAHNPVTREIYALTVKWP